MTKPKIHTFTQPDQAGTMRLLCRATLAWLDAEDVRVEADRRALAGPSAGVDGLGEVAGEVQPVRVPGAGSGFVLHLGLGYVVLRDAVGAEGAVLAVYRVRPDNLLLRRLVRWPAEVAPRA